MSLLSDSEKLYSTLEHGLTSIVPDLSKEIWDKLIELIDELDTQNGHFVPNNNSRSKLLAIQSEIEEILNKAGYFTEAKSFISDLNKITENSIALHKGLNDLTIPPNLITGIEKSWVEIARQSLGVSGINQSFMQPVSQLLNEAITYGYSIQETRAQLEQYVNTSADAPSRLKSYLTITSRQIVSELQGAQQQAIQQKYDLQYIAYIGNIQDNSAAQCVYWKTMRNIPVSELQKEINKARKAQEMGEKIGRYKYSGLPKDLNPLNFCAKAGHVGCLHQKIPVRKKI